MAVVDGDEKTEPLKNASDDFRVKNENITIKYARMRRYVTTIRTSVIVPCGFRRYSGQMAEWIFVRTTFVAGSNTLNYHDDRNVV